MSEVEHYETIELRDILVNRWEDPRGNVHHEISLAGVWHNLEAYYGKGAVEIALDVDKGHIMIVVP